MENVEMKGCLNDFFTNNHRPFHSEADFQHELAIYLRDKLKGEIRLEKPMGDEAIDLFLMHGDDSEENIGIELKYKTKGDDFQHNEEHFDLKKQGKHTETRKGFKSDIKRLQKWQEGEGKKKKITTGYAIFLTNDCLYFTPKKPNGEPYVNYIHGEWQPYCKFGNFEFKYLIVEVWPKTIALQNLYCKINLPLTMFFMEQF